jgi:hypothetical protein
MLNHLDLIGAEVDARASQRGNALHRVTQRLAELQHRRVEVGA